MSCRQIEEDLEITKKRQKKRICGKASFSQLLRSFLEPCVIPLWYAWPLQLRMYSNLLLQVASGSQLFASVSSISGNLSKYYRISFKYNKRLLKLFLDTSASYCFACSSALIKNRMPEGRYLTSIKLSNVIYSGSRQKRIHDVYYSSKFLLTFSFMYSCDLLNESSLKDIVAQ